jgi:hypothetical protein
VSPPKKSCRFLNTLCQALCEADVKGAIAFDLEPLEVAQTTVLHGFTKWSILPRINLLQDAIHRPQV